MTRRQERVNDLLREVIAEIVTNELKDPRLDVPLLSITEARTSPDLRHARVLVSIMGTTEQQEEAMTALRHSARVVRKLLRPHLAMKAIPTLSFHADNRIAEERRINDLINALEPAPTPAPADPAAPTDPTVPTDPTAPADTAAPAAPATTTTPNEIRP